MEWGAGRYKDAEKDMRASFNTQGLWTCQKKKAVFTGNNSHNQDFPVKRRALAEIQVITYVLQDKKVLDHIKKGEAKEQFVMNLLEEVVERA